MEASFWSGLALDNFMFKHVNIQSYPGFIGVCVVAAAIALAFEGSRTVRDWLYLEFLKKRSCYRASNDVAIVLRDLRSTNGCADKSAKEDSTDNKKIQSAMKDHAEISDSSGVVNSSVVPVIATGTIQGLGTNCHKPSFHVGLMELLLSTFLHMFQVLLGYVLMLMVMTFNVWIFVAVLAGTSTGFFVFDSFNKKIHALKMSTQGTPKK